MSLANINESDQFERGKGIGYGCEFLFKIEEKPLHLWVSYTLSKAKQQFPNANQGFPIAPMFDRRHVISIWGECSITNDLDVSISWTFATGQPFTVPTDLFIQPDGSIGAEYPAQRNVDRLPCYHRMDLQVSYHFNLFGLPSEFFVTIYNVYGHQNPLAVSVVFKDKDGNIIPNTPSEIPTEVIPIFEQFSALPFFPSFGFRCSFSRKK